VKEFENQSKHDVKAIEYFLRKKLKKDLLPFIHFGLTSYDINDNAHRLIILDGLKNVVIPELKTLLQSLNNFSNDNIKLPLLGRTHGQPAVPTTLGKEFFVFATRLDKEIKKVNEIKLFGKFGGAVGNWNSLAFAFPDKNWVKLSEKFLQTLDLNFSKVTTQTAPPEDIIEVFQTFIRINNILLDLDQDVWRYISDNWLVQKGKSGNVGSSTMPQKVNPIEFENSEGNLTMANGIFEIFVKKFPISRLQRDLSDSTVLRNIGIAFAHSLIAYHSCLNGLETISPNKEKIKKDLNENWAILTEALQTILRKQGYIDAYEKVASQIRGLNIDRDGWIKLVNSFDISQKDKNRLESLTPESYLGLSQKINA